MSPSNSYSQSFCKHLKAPSDLKLSFTEGRVLESGELIPQNERELRCSEGSGMLIGDPLGEGSNASSTDSEL